MFCPWSRYLLDFQLWPSHGDFKYFEIFRRETKILGLQWGKESQLRKWKLFTDCAAFCNLLPSLSKENSHSQVSRTRRANDGVVFTAERPSISFVMWNEKGFCRVEWDRLSMRRKQRIWLVFRNTLLSWQFYCMSRKERCSHGIYGHFALTLNLYLFFNPKPSAISRTPSLVKISPKLLCQILKKSLGL